MEYFINYLLQVALSLALLHGIYRLFVRTETFHRLNRWVLMGSLLLSALLPAISIPAIGQQTAGIMDGFSYFLLPVVVSAEGPGTAAENLRTASLPGFWQLAGMVYITVSGILLFRLLFQLAGISRLILCSDRVPQDGYYLVISKKVHTPFSFFRYIFLNPKDLGAAGSRQILDHEEVHSRQLHSVDNLLAELYALIFWFSPVSWWHKREILLNLEYLADNGALEKGCEPGDYQLQLLKASLRDTRFALANHFAQSIIKRRIKMMNTEKSPLRRAWKYLLLIPAAAAALLLLNCTGEFEQEKTGGPDTETGREGSISESLVTPDTSHQNGTGYNFAEVDKKPVFPGGNDKILEYVGENFTYPAAAREAGIEGTVYVMFTIMADGSVNNVKAVRGEDLGGGLAEEAVRVVKSMPAWTPAEQKGKKVAVSYTLPVFCRLSTTPKRLSKDDPDNIYSFAIVNKKPQFPGGNDKIMSYIGENFLYPSEALEKDIQGSVYIQFMIEKDGSISNVKCVRGQSLGGGLAEEGVRVVSSMPAWTPGEHKGEKVAVSYTLPIFASVQK